MIETVTQDAASRTLFCNTCAHDWREMLPPQRFTSLDDLVQRTKLRREEVQTLAEIGALNTFGFHRRAALWQAERAVRPAGELFVAPDNAGLAEPAEQLNGRKGSALPLEARPAPDASPRSPNTGQDSAGSAGSALSQASDESGCPLAPMSDHDRLVADYAGTGMTIGPHPMAMRRGDLATRGVLRAIDLPRGRHGRRVRVAGTVITRQRPGTAKGFVFLTLEDETGIANVIVRPDLFAAQRSAIITEPFLLVEGILQMQDGVTAVKAERVERLQGTPAIEIDSHDFH